MPASGERRAADCRDYTQLSVAEMEQMLAKARKGGSGTPRAPMSARAVLEENRIEAIKKRQDKLRSRTANRVQEAELLQNEHALLFQDLDADNHKRAHARELADQYRAEISEREQGRRRSRAWEEPEEFFPFTGGEELEKQRRQLARKHQVELMDHMERTKKPGGAQRANDPLIPPPQRPYGDADPDSAAPPKAHSFNSEYPSFLQPSRVYISRLVDPKQQIHAMQQRVAATYEKIQKEWDDKKKEDGERSVGLHLNDHLRQEDRKDASEKNRANAAALRVQIEEQRARRKHEEAEVRSVAPGYFGPQDRENKVVKGIQQRNGVELKDQMEADRARRRDIREYELAQDRLYAENQVQDLVQERQTAVQKSRKNRELLRSSWAQQVKMRAVRAIVQSV